MYGPLRWWAVAPTEAAEATGELGVGLDAHLRQVQAGDFVLRSGPDAALGELFWILKKAKAMPPMTTMITTQPMAWATSWRRPSPTSYSSPNPKMPVTPLSPTLA